MNTSTASITATRTPVLDFLAQLTNGQPQLQQSPWPGIASIRSAAKTRLETLRLPTLRDEDWRFTDLAPLTRLSLGPARAGQRLTPADIEPFLLDGVASRLVFVDGVYAPQLSTPTHPARAGEVVVANLPEAMLTHAAAIEAQLGRHQSLDANVFAALNSASLQDAAVIVVPRNVALAAPVHLLFIATQADVHSSPRCLLIAEAGSQVTLIEDYVSLQDEAAYLINPVTEIVLAEQAQVRHVRVQRDSLKAHHIANCSVAVGRHANYQSVSVALGAQISRYNAQVLLAEAAECAVDGLALISGSQLADTHSFIDHARPHGVSRQLHKCIAGGSAHAVFNGLIMVRQGAQQTDSAQSNRNLLLSAKAHIDTKPQLEIFADDVKCAHGATIGQLDPEEVFYLQSRGLTDSAARKLLTYAFGAEVIERIHVPSLKHQLQQLMQAQTGSHT